MPSTVLILGANGRLGRALVDAFHGAGWQVLAHTRRALSTPVQTGVETVMQPITDVGGIAAIASDADVVVHAMNPPYPRWADQAMPLAQAAMNIAVRTGATLMLPGNVYQYGTPMPAVLDESTTPAPTTRKGVLRLQIEAAMQARSSLRSIVVRAGDFFGGPGRGSWFDLVIAKQIEHGRAVYPGPLDIEHAWAYVPDLAQTFVRVAAQREALGHHTALHFPGHTLTGRTLIDALDASAHRLGLLPQDRRLRVSGLPWTMLRAGGLVLPMWREIAEMRYLWNEPHRLSGASLTRWIGAPPMTPLPRALDESLSALLSHTDAAPPAS